VQVTGLSAGVRSLSAGGATACAVTSGRAVTCWGANGDGVLGDGKADNVQTSSNVPVAVTGLKSRQASVTVGDNDTACAVTTKGRTRCWGYNYDGTLGNGTDQDSSVPVQVRGLTHGVTRSEIGTYTVCALTRTGQVRCWGYVPVGTGFSEVPVTLPWAS
jgi:alpha-tubulin suppressor-like RCC1 family protein